jgi:CheY-like chemotaxis protein
MPEAVRQRILIVDEDQLLGEFYSCLLALQGFVPVWASNGEQAKRILTQQASFALAVIDLLPPTEEYWNLIQHLKQTPATANMPIITITGISLSYDELEKIKQCCNAVLLKGNFELAKFKDTVTQLSH